MRKCKIILSGYEYSNYRRFFDLRSIEGKDKFNSNEAAIRKGDILPIITQALHEHGEPMIYVVQKNGCYALIGERGIEIIETCIQK